MKTALIVTVGTRDVQIDREYIIKNESHDIYSNLYLDNRILKARQGGDFLKKQYNRYKQNLKIPIIKPAVDFCLKNEGNIDHTILITTDQSESVDDKFRSTDTLHFGELIKKILSDRYPKSVLPDIRNKSVKENVTYLDAMTLFWQRELYRKPYNLLQECDTVYLCNQGGIDAINTALLLQCLNAYGDKTQVLQVDQGTGICTPLEFTKIYLANSENTKLNQLLDNYQYAAIKKLNVNKNIKALAAYAEHRLMFDFEEAVHSLNGLDMNYRKIKIDLQACTNQIPGNHDLLLRELCLNALIKFQQDAYVDFLLRFFRIREELAKNKAIQYLGFNFNFRHWGKDIKNYLQKPENKSIRDFLESQKIDGSPLDYTKATTETFLRIVKYFSKEEYAQLEKYKKLSNLRNNSIGAHSFEPVSRRSIENVLENAGLSVESMFDYLAEKTGFDKDEFTKLNDTIKEMQ